jgi:hypothetical protein
MADVPEVPAQEEDIVFTSSDYTESPASTVREPAATPAPEIKPKKEGEPESILENKRIALIIAIVGFIVISIVFGYLFSTLDWELILSGGNVTSP